MSIRVVHKHNLVDFAKVKRVTKQAHHDVQAAIVSRVDHNISFTYKQINEDESLDAEELGVLLKRIDLFKRQKEQCSRPYGGYGTYRTYAITFGTNWFSERILPSDLNSSYADQMLWYSMEHRK